MAVDPKASLFPNRTMAEPLRPDQARREAELDQLANKITREGKSSRRKGGVPTQLNVRLSQPWHFEMIAELSEYLEELKKRPGGKLSQGDFILLAIRSDLDRRKAADAEKE